MAELVAVVDLGSTAVRFLIAKIVGKGPMDHAKCVEFWGSETDACKAFPK